jgi:hypothetical protein
MLVFEVLHIWINLDIPPPPPNALMACIERYKFTFTFIHYILALCEYRTKQPGVKLANNKLFTVCLSVFLHVTEMTTRWITFQNNAVNIRPHEAPYYGYNLPHMSWGELHKVSCIRHKLSSSVYRTGCVCFWCLQPKHVAEEVIRVAKYYCFYVMAAGTTTSDLLRCS